YAAWVVSCSFASTAGVLLGLGTALNPTMGFDIILLIFAAVIVGGIGSPYGAMLGGLLVGLSQEMSVPFLLWLERPDVIGLQFGTAYKVAIPFIILFVVLIFRPWGIAGRRPAFARRSFFIDRITRVIGGERGAIETSAGAANGSRWAMASTGSGEVAKQLAWRMLPWSEIIAFVPMVGIALAGVLAGVLAG